MTRRTTQFIYSLLGINSNPSPPPASPPAPPNPGINPNDITILQDAAFAQVSFSNPLNDAGVATKLTQVNTNNNISIPSFFNADDTYNIFVPSTLATNFLNAPAGSKPKAKVSLFYGVGPEIDLFRLKDFFSAETNSVLITVPGVEAETLSLPANQDPWRGIHKAFGKGITTQMIKDLFSNAGLGGIDFNVEVIAAYSTGYRGVNLTIINELIDLSKLTRLIYLDAWYHHDDHPLMPSGTTFFQKNTLMAVTTAFSKSPNMELVIYAYTPGGVPRANPAQTNPSLPSPPREPISNLISSHPGKVHFIDFNFKFDGRPAIEEKLEKICLARLIQFGIGGAVNASAVHASLMPLINGLPIRGSLGTLGRSGYTDLYSWINSNQGTINGFDFTKSFNLVNRFNLLDGWTTTARGEMRHRTFVIELGKEPLLP